LLDEFQDTSLTQWQVMRPFAEQVASGSPAKSFFCVGDVKQAIYGWRGGIAEIFDALEGHFEGLTREALNHSFRSAKPVIDTVNQIFSGIVKHPHLDDLQEAVQNWSDRFEPQTTSKDKLPGYTCLITAPQAAQDEKQINITLAFSAECIAEIVQQAPGHSVGVLVRTNTAVAQLIFELRRLGVPASEEGGRPLTDSAAVGVVTSLLRMADHPGDTVARFHVSHSPLGQVVGFSDDQDDVAAHRLAQQVRRTLLADGYGPTVGAWVREMADSVNQRDLSRLNQLVELAYGYEPTATLRTTDFVNYVESERVSDPTSDHVRVMTIHQAKGLQFDVVVLADLDSNLIRQRNAFVTGHSDPTLPVNRVCPYRNTRIQSLLPDDLRQMFRRATHRAVTESLCVLYVALTRAVHALHLIISPSKEGSSSKEGKQKLPKSAAGLLRAALTDGRPIPPTTTLFEEGDDEWFVQSNRDRPTAARQVDAEPLEVRLAGRTDGRTRGLERATPSGREGGTRVQLANVLRLGNERALERGTLIHAWFEQIRWLDEGRPDETVLRRIAAEIGVTGLNVDEQIQQFYDMLDSPQTARVLSRGSYHSTQELAFEAAVSEQLAAASLRFEVHNERRFAVREGDTILSGSIDRLVLMCHDDIPVAADVIDFKTDAVSADDESALAETVEYYRGQLESYRPAVAAMYGLSPERISAKLLFVGPGIVRNV
jgi:ATP-dependent exoDNAse (exonuclease V) beta subunit